MDTITQDKAINELLPHIEAYQTDYIKSNPYFFQGLPTNSDVPSASVVCDELDSKPQAKPTAWVDTGLITKAIPFSMEIHEYDAKEGKGYQVFFRTKNEIGDTFIRSVGYGCESASRTFDWVEELNFNALTTK